MSNELHTAPVTIEEIELWQESTPGDYKDWDEETIADCDGFLTVLMERVKKDEPEPVLMTAFDIWASDIDWPDNEEQDNEQETN